MQAACPDPLDRTSNPHYLLYSEASGPKRGAPRWRFVLQRVGSGDRFSAADLEPETRAGRLELLAVVRGLEALDQPSRVTLVTRSRYVARGIRRELNHWRDRSWCWERFGKLVPIRDHDLWRRVDRAMQFHSVECVAWDQDTPDAIDASPPLSARLATSSCEGKAAWPRSLVRRLHILRDGVLAPFSAIFRPAFTRAA
jgi:ribonuclease HI